MWKFKLEQIMMSDQPKEHENEQPPKVAETSKGEKKESMPDKPKISLMNFADVPGRSNVGVDGKLQDEFK